MGLIVGLIKDYPFIPEIVRCEMTACTKTIIIAAPIERVWAALTNADDIAAWMGGEVESDLQVGGKYAYFEGETTGVYTLVDHPQCLEYTWRQSNWDQGWADFSCAGS